VAPLSLHYSERTILHIICNFSLFLHFSFVYDIIRFTEILLGLIMSIGPANIPLSFFSSGSMFFQIPKPFFHTCKISLSNALKLEEKRKPVG